MYRYGLGDFPLEGQPDDALQGLDDDPLSALDMWWGVHQTKEVAAVGSVGSVGPGSVGPRVAPPAPRVRDSLNGKMMEAKIEELVEVVCANLSSSLGQKLRDGIMEASEAPPPHVRRSVSSEMPPSPPSGISSLAEVSDIKMALRELETQVTLMGGGLNSVKGELTHLKKDAYDALQNGGELAHRISTLEGRQRGLQSKAAHLDKALGPKVTDWCHILEQFRSQAAAAAAYDNCGSPEVVKAKQCEERDAEFSESQKISELEERVMALESAVTERSQALSSSGSKGSTDSEIRKVRSEVTELTARWKAQSDALAIVESGLMAVRDQLEPMQDSVSGLKQLVEDMLRKQKAGCGSECSCNAKSAEVMLTDHVKTISREVAALTRQYVASRIDQSSKLMEERIDKKMEAVMKS